MSRCSICRAATTFSAPDYGGATVHTNVRAGYTDECPNVGRFLENLVFSLEMENEIMGAILDENQDPEAAANRVAEREPRGARCLLAGVETFKGGADSAETVRSALGIN